MDLYKYIPGILKELCGSAVTSEQEVNSLWYGQHHDLADLKASLPENIAAYMRATTMLASEDMVLEIIDHVFNNTSRHSPKGRGDDCAEIICKEQGLSISTDFFLEDTHFRTSYFTPLEVGAKALSRATSDLAATGATPLGFTLGLMLPEETTPTAILQIAHGMKTVADLYDMALVGGDITKSPFLGFCMTVWGEHKDYTMPLGRKVAIPGDAIFAVGPIGLARLGLFSLENSGRAGITHYPSSVMAHLMPRPLISQGLALSKLATTYTEQKPAIGLMDVSDGLAMDLPRLLGTLGANLNIEDVHPEVQYAALEHDLNPVEFAYTGGEDYALLGTCSIDILPDIIEKVPHCTSLGTVGETGIFLNDKLFSGKGFDHFFSHANTRNSFEPTENKLLEYGTILLKNSNAKMQSITGICHKASRFGLMAGFSGNASIRDFAAGNTACLITASGSIKGALNNMDFSIISLEKSCTLNPENYLFPHLEISSLAGATPSSEALMHLAIYHTRPDAKAILHTHPPKMLALGMALPQDQRMHLPLFESKAYAKLMGYAPAMEPGTSALAMAVGDTAKNFNAIWMENHGLVVLAETLEKALALTEELEQLAYMQLLSMRSNHSI